MPWILTLDAMWLLSKFVILRIPYSMNSIHRRSKISFIESGSVRSLRFPQLKEIRFESNNRTWETILEQASAGEGKVFTEPRPPYGFQGFSMTKRDLEGYERWFNIARTGY